ncbi:putative RNA recognition motif domain, nucleotide-binding alpha-beta plait domain superfamily [Helianthus annuus]|uniref:RNA recognition motif domain, nucleotide-binding alpha-beta plait domain superfamily n=1 Tax=Helianthus annuus TaxID=4232 RepID=A0A9K3HRA8_HELAN|nr:putative RNA recognition motif domain, nucleotide-binding alpha-beta plait domain superfamily [Helianthus annuus]KAJ0502287.1 putative RNA recognition motif domain, nucleotide-binding alpha-beta plait domain superfamily [Helianthus annuus]KAJ0510310.1 putative RNA recognition motif domain, nucleotide-binding alpha-beta plait domain superfamily [Helianthus annuus]KAJ0518207.1 putative RNA recognition motif domain, nucleotide-binding alpha-beta plait domain superfamily [Helianthus annuus]KAJ06
MAKRGREQERKEERPNVLKFFVTYIPSRCRPWDLANAFRSYGEIGGAFIAKKKDKERTFGFVSFKGVRNTAELEDSLQKIKLGGNKLKVNVAMFSKENGDCAHKIEAGSKRGEGAPDILMNRSSPVLEEDTVDIDPVVFTLSDLFGRAYVVRAKDFNSLRLLNVSMRSAGYAEAEIQYIGGLSIIMSFAGRFFEDMVI